MKNILYICTTLVLLVSSNCFATPSQPTPSGSFANGGSVTISGTGFMADASPSPLLWKTFEDRTVGVNVIGDDGWTTTALSSNVTYSSSYPRTSFSTISVKDHLDYSAGVKGNFQRESLPVSKSKKFVSFWWRPTPIHATTSTLGNAQLKAFRVAAGSSHADFPTLELDTTWDTNSNLTQTVLGLYSSSTSTWWSLVPKLNTWTRVDLLLEDSDLNSSNGSWGCTHFAGTTKQSTFKTSIPTRTTTYNDFFSWITLGYTLVNAPGYIIDTYWDDVYASDSWSRVELCNASTYSESTTCEIQRQTSRTDTSISIVVNTGSFASGSTAYLYVIDNDNTASSSRSITISGTTPVVNGLCGDESATVNIRPSATCVTGTPSATTENINTTTWTCVGSGGGTTDSCSAPFSTVSGDPAVFALGNSAYTVTEGQTFSVPVYRTDNTVGAGSVTYRTVGVTASGTLDYSGTNSDTVYFADGETSTAITVSTWKDFLLEETETFTLEITGTSGTTGSPSSATMSILDGNEPVVKPRGLVLPLGQGTIWRAYPTGESIRVTQ